MPEQDSESDTTVDDIEESKHTETLQVHNVLNKTIHDEDDSIDNEDELSQEEHVDEIQTYGDNGEQTNLTENKLLTTNFKVKGENQKLRAHSLFNRSTNIQN